MVELKEITTIDQLADRVRRNADAFEDLEAAIDYNVQVLTRTEELNILKRRLSLMFKTVPGINRTLSALIDDVIGDELWKMLNDKEEV